MNMLRFKKCTTAQAIGNLGERPQGALGVSAQRGIAMVEGMLVAAVSVAVIAALMPTAINAYDGYKVQQATQLAVESTSKLQDYFVVLGSTSTIEERVPEILQLQTLPTQGSEAALLESTVNQIQVLQGSVQRHFSSAVAAAAVQQGTGGQVNPNTNTNPTGQQLPKVGKLSTIEHGVSFSLGSALNVQMTYGSGGSLKFKVLGGSGSTTFTQQEFEAKYKINMKDPSYSEVISTFEDSTGKTLTQNVTGIFSVSSVSQKAMPLSPMGLDPVWQLARATGWVPQELNKVNTAHQAVASGSAQSAMLNLYFGAAPSGAQVYKSSLGPVSFHKARLFEDNDAFVMSFNGISASQCSKMLPLVSKSFAGMSVNATPVVGASGALVSQQSISGPRAVQVCNEQADQSQDGRVNVHMMSASLFSKMIGQNPFGTDPQKALQAREANYTMVNSTAAESPTLEPAASPSGSLGALSSGPMPGEAFTAPSGTTLSDPCGGWGYTTSTVPGCSGGTAPTAPEPTPTDPPPASPGDGGGG